MTPQPAPIGFASARWLLAAVGTSKLGGLSFGVVATWAIGSALGSDAVGTTNACAGVATLLVGLFGTFWIDRVDRRKLLIAIDVTAAAACGVVSAWQFTHPGSVSLAQIATLMILLAALAALYSPSSRALTPLITDPRSLIRVNSAYAIVSEVARSAGPVVGAALLLGGDAGLPAATAVNGISFLVSAALTMAVSTRCAEAPTDRSEKRLELILGGVRFLKLDRALSREVWCATSLNFFLMAPTFVLLTRSTQTGWGAAAFGLGNVAEAAGALAGGIAAGVLASRINGFRAAHLAPVVATGLACLTIDSLAVTALVLFTLGGVVAAYNVVLFTKLQTSAPAALIGRVFAFVVTLAGASLPLGNMVFGQLSSAVSPPVLAMIAAIGFVAVSAVVLLASRRPPSLLPPADGADAPTDRADHA
ncbi:MFS transporter [Clavibacter capsici]|uniref:MFS transporter n=2 Tax=Clavibacter capsici TaxID=1874630 RepID=UPI001428040E|nr:MFS transporter [Clavibacter capsici]QIS41247.1 MFS transporter [Clavibacter capsici]